MRRLAMAQVVDGADTDGADDETDVAGGDAASWAEDKPQ